MSRARLLTTLVATAAVLAGAAAQPAAAAPDEAARAAAGSLDEGMAFIDGIGDGVYDRYVHEPGRIAGKDLLLGEGPSASRAWRGYDFSDDVETLYGVVDDGFIRSLAVVDQESGAFESEVGAMAVHPVNTHVLSDLTVDPRTGVAYAASISQTGPVESTVYTVDLETAQTTELATTGGVELIDMSMNCQGQMYAVDIKTDRLVKVDPKTGVVTGIGPIGLPLSNSQGIDFDNATGILHAWLYDATAGKTKYSKLDLRTGTPTLFSGGTVDGEYEGAIKTECPSPKCPQLKKKLKQAKKGLATAQKQLAKAKKTGKQAKIAKAKKKVTTAKKKVKKAKKAAAAGNC